MDFSSIFYFFTSSGKLCPGNNTCSDNGVCDSTTGVCSCYDQFYGDGCESKYENKLKRHVKLFVTIMRSQDFMFF